MLQCELENGRMLFINLEKVNNIVNQPDGVMVLTYVDPEGKVKRNHIKRFQVIKTATWFRSDR